MAPQEIEKRRVLILEAIQTFVQETNHSGHSCLLQCPSSKLPFSLYYNYKEVVCESYTICYIFKKLMQFSCYDLNSSKRSSPDICPDFLFNDQVWTAVRQPEATLYPFKASVAFLLGVFLVHGSALWNCLKPIFNIVNKNLLFYFILL